MKQSKKWSEQQLVEHTFTHNDENGNEVRIKKNVLHVVTSGKELFRKSFIEDADWKKRNQLILPFDFVMVPGDFAPEGGLFYELEYHIGEKGAVYRGLLQLCNPVEDIRTVLGMMQRKNLLPKGFNPIKLYLRDDIDVVSIDSCYKDEDGEPQLFGSQSKASKDYTQTITEHCRDNADHTGTCMYYYRGDHREYWMKSEDALNFEKVFVCGENGNDPEFTDQREADLGEMELNLSEALDTVHDYNIPHLFIWQDSEGNYEFRCGNLPTEILEKLMMAAKEYQDKQNR